LQFSASVSRPSLACKTLWAILFLHSNLTETDDILKDQAHRPWSIRNCKWQYYQEWNNVLFLHWKLPYTALRKCVPEKLHLDSFNGEYYISLVAFTMQKIRPRNLPSINLISDFHEINIRTYIDNDNKKGVYFLSIEAEKYISAIVAKTLSRLPYEKSNIKRSDKSFLSINSNKDHSLNIEYLIGTKLTAKTELDKWLTERYCLFMKTDKEYYRYEIHHKEWEIKTIDINKLNLKYKIGGLDFSSRKPDIVHYSDGVKVLSWNKQKLG
jgi:uncharacterized protein YqjF (DUF2071 family)